MRDWGRWSVGTITSGPKGTKQFGVALWGNETRTGFQANFWRWEFQLMRERNW